MATLRGPGGCPWDHEQTHESILPQLIEEAYEFIDAVESKNDPHTMEELGDLLLHIVFHAQIATDRGAFNINQVIEGLCDKLIRRHPHVFGKTKVKNADEVMVNWDEIKSQEKKNHTGQSLLDSVPKGLPALFQAFKLSKKASKVGFDWKKITGVVDKIEEEIEELKEALKNKKQNAITDEVGDLFFSLANLCRFIKVNPEEALRKSNKKFRNRFSNMEKQIKKSKKNPSKLSEKEWNNLWNKAKKK